MDLLRNVQLTLSPIRVNSGGVFSVFLLAITDLRASGERRHYMWINNADRIASVTRNGMNLMHIPVEHRTHAICWAAVKQTGWAIEFVRDQTIKICLAVAKQEIFYSTLA